MTIDKLNGNPVERVERRERARLANFALLLSKSLRRRMADVDNRPQYTPKALDTPGDIAAVTRAAEKLARRRARNLRLVASGGLRLSFRGVA